MILRTLRIALVLSACWAACAAAASPNGVLCDRASVGIVAEDGDPGIPLVREAVGYWNAVLAGIGIPFRLGEVRRITLAYEPELLWNMSDRDLEAPGTLPFPSFLAGAETELVVILTASGLVSFSERWPAEGKALVAIRSADIAPLPMPNVARNIIAHELGHAIGLGHNDIPGTLMCGRPAHCRPEAFVAPAPRFFPLTRSEERKLAGMYAR